LVFRLKSECGGWGLEGLSVIPPGGPP